MCGPSAQEWSAADGLRQVQGLLPARQDRIEVCAEMRQPRCGREEGRRRYRYRHRGGRSGADGSVIGTGTQAARLHDLYINYFTARTIHFHARGSAEAGQPGSQTVITFFNTPGEVEGPPPVSLPFPTIYMHTKTKSSRRQAMDLHARKVRADSVGARSHISSLGPAEEEARMQKLG